MRFFHLNLFRIAVLLSVQLGGVAFAQIQFGNLQLQHATGTLGAGYDGQINGGQDSSHDIGLNGSADINGSYYNPNFLSFNASTYYDRAQSNAGSTNLGTSEGYYLGSHVFGGSNTPGNLNFGQDWGKNSTYGVAGLSGLDSTSNDRNFGVDWQFRKLGVVRNLDLSYSDNANYTSVIGIGATSNVKTQAFGVSTSGYTFAGFSLGGGYQHLNSNSDSNLYNTSGSLLSSTTSLDMFHVMTARALPFHGKFNLSAYRMTSTSSSDGESDNTASDEIDTSITSHVWRAPLSGYISYNDNVYGSVLQQLDASGQTVSVSTTSPRTGALLMNVSSSYAFPYRIFVTGFAEHEEAFVEGQTVSATSAGANAAYNFGKYFKGLSVMVGMNDSASQEGNNGGGLIANVNYIRNIGNWHFSANANYNQNVQTLLAMYTSSSAFASGAIRREFTNGMMFSIGGGYGSSVFSSAAGDNTNTKNAVASFSWLKQTVSGAYMESGGSAVVTNSGLVTVTTPGLVSNTTMPYMGRSYTAGYSNSIVKHLTMSLGWSEFQNSSPGVGVLSNVSSQMYTGYLTYVYRKLNFLANATYVHQGTEADITSAMPSRTLVYYFGVSRWFSLF